MPQRTLSFQSNPIQNPNEETAFNGVPKSSIKDKLITADEWLKIMNVTPNITFKPHGINPGEKRLPLSDNILKEFAPGTREKERNKNIEKEKNHISHLITDRTKYNTQQLKACGIRESEVYKYLKSDGRVTDEGRKILREHGKTPR